MYHVYTCPEAVTEFVRQSVHLVPANHLLHNWSLSSVNAAECSCLLSQRAPSIYWSFVIFTTPESLHSFQLNEQHLDDIQYEVYQIQHKNPSQTIKKRKCCNTFHLWRVCVWTWKPMNKKGRSTSVVRLLHRQASGPVSPSSGKRSLTSQYDSAKYVSGSLTLNF